MKRLIHPVFLKEKANRKISAIPPPVKGKGEKLKKLHARKRKQKIKVVNGIAVLQIASRSHKVLVWN